LREWRRNPVNLVAVSRTVDLLRCRLKIDEHYEPFGSESRRLIQCPRNFPGREDVCQNILLRCTRARSPSST
jgi:hypothetical protein